jgi:galactose mutarotase-like enzyme
MMIHPINLDNGVIRLIVLPDLGGKIASLVRIASGHSFLLSPEQVGKTYRMPAYGDPFRDYDTSGFDECFPTVSACRYPCKDSREVMLPDHGELWSVPWSVAQEDGTIYLEAQGRAIPYSLRKKICLDGPEVQIEYELVNRCHLALSYLWSAHPLLVPEAMSRILLPEDVNEVLIEWSRNADRGTHGDTWTWPLWKGEDLRLILPPTVGAAHKLFTPRLRRGYCSFFKPKANESITFSFDPELVPYLGVWVCQGGWPEVEPRGHYAVALEPCTARFDSLFEAAAHGDALTLRPGERRSWWLRMRVQAGPAMQQL